MGVSSHRSMPPCSAICHNSPNVTLHSQTIFGMLPRQKPMPPVSTIIGVLTKRASDPILAPAKPKKATNVGVIAAGAVGGVAGLSLIVLLCIFIIRRRNSKRVAPPSLIYATQYSGPTPLAGVKPNLGYNNTGSTTVPTGSSSPVPPMRLYVRSTCFPFFYRSGLFLGAGFTDFGSCRIPPILPLSLRR